MSSRDMFLIFAICVTGVIGHIPKGYNDWTEASGNVYVSGPKSTIAKQQTLERLSALRELMGGRNVDAYIIPTADAHNSEYIAPCDARREWISGFTGSAGTAVVTSSNAQLWTDGRYFTQFYLEVNTTHWELMRQGIDLQMEIWLRDNLEPYSIVGVDPTTYTRNSWDTLQSSLSAYNITIEAIPENLVDMARINFGDPAPARPNNVLLPLTVDYTGKLASEKIAELRTQMQSKEASVLVLTALDDIAYTLNVRGSDIPYNPVFFFYLLIRNDDNNDIILFWGDDGSLSPDIVQHLASEGVTVEGRPYEEVFEYLRSLTSSLPDGSTIWLPQDGSHAIHTAAETNAQITKLSTVSPVALMKCIKNDVELQGFRSAHIKDGIAVVRFLRWVHEQVASGVNVTEINVVDKLVELRSEEIDFMGPSFETIAGAGENGAIIHYSPSREGEQRVIRTDDMLLVDSGGQYKDGTTDITRTRHMSASPTEAQRRTFTRVLKGQILMGTAVFPRGSTGNLIETLARKALWDVGLDYAHGTGHGVGHFLNVHEGPSGIGGALLSTDPGIVPGMIFSDEPGYYEVEEYGIRHEDLVEVIEMTRDVDHILADGMVGDFEGKGAVSFRILSLVPHQTSCLDVSILNDMEIKYINSYHSRVLTTLGPILQERGLIEDFEWLENECTPIQRGHGFIVRSSPLVIMSIVSIIVRL